MKNVIILAAGKGTRMKSELPKCACPILGKPMIKYLVDACIDAGIDNIIVVVGYKKEIIKEVLKDYPNIYYAYQEEQLGTGHACMVTKELLSSVNGTTVIVPGDMPLVGKDNLINILNYHEENNLAMTILSSIFDNPFSYGRIVRNSNNNVTAIVEEKECTKEQKLIKEINTGLYAVDNKTLFESLKLEFPDVDKLSGFVDQSLESVNAFEKMLNDKPHKINNALRLKNLIEKVS